MTKTLAGAKTLRWMPPSEEAVNSFICVKETLAHSLNEAASLCSLLRCFNVPDSLHLVCVEDIRPTEGLLATIQVARSTAAALLSCDDPVEAMKLTATAILLTGCLIQIYGLVVNQKRTHGDA
jgi:hypothetical protein